jgi:glycerol kinase
VWDPTTGQPVYNAIVWQCRRTADLVEQLCGTPEARQMIQRRRGFSPMRTSRPARSSGSSTTCPVRRERAEAGELLFGTVDTWLVWVLTEAWCTRPTSPTPAARCCITSTRTAGTRSSRPLWDSAVHDARGQRSSGSFGETSYPGVPGGHPHHRRGGRPAVRPVWPVLLRAGAGQKHVRHGLLHAHEHRTRGAHLSTTWSRPSRRRPRARRPTTRWRAASLWRGPHPMAARRDAPHPHGRGDGVPRQERAGHRWRVHRAGVHGPGRPLLEP